LAAEPDLCAWYILATEVSPIFQHSVDMGTDPDFVSYAQNNEEYLWFVNKIKSKNKIK